MPSSSVSTALSPEPDDQVIVVGEEVVPFEETLQFDNCGSNISVENNITYNQILSEMRKKELVLEMEGGAEAQIPETLKVHLAGKIEQHFANEKTTVTGSETVARFTVRPYEKLAVTLFMEEVIKTGSVSTTVNGQLITLSYRYRVRLHHKGWKTTVLPCPATPIPSTLSTPSCEPGFDKQIWTPLTTDSEIHFLLQGGCWLLGSVGIKNTTAGISMLKERQAVTKAHWYGVVRPLPPDPTVDLVLQINRLANGRIWIGFLPSAETLHGKFLVIKPQEGSVSNNKGIFDLIEVFAGGGQRVLQKNYRVPYDNGRYEIQMPIRTDRLKVFINRSSTSIFGVVEVKQDYLFIGYLAQNGLRLDAIVSVKIVP